MALRVTFWGTRGSIPALRYEEISRTGGPLRISVAYDGLEIEL